MFAVLALIAFVIALILQLASVSRGVFLTAATFTIIGLLCLAAHLVWGLPVPWRRPPP